MESLKNVPNNRTPEEESALDSRRAAFVEKAETVAKEYGVTCLEVLELYASKMDRQLKIFDSNKEALEAIFNNPANEEQYWDTVETALALDQANQKSAIYEELATKDTLTGLDNRRSLETQLDKMVANYDRNQTPFSFIMIDLDNFKSINDTFGHGVGDQVLKAVAEEIKNHARTTDLACRIGGEEMVVLVTGDKSAATILAERIRQSIASIDVEKLGIDKNMRKDITASIGVAEYVNGTNYSELIESADGALYQAKAGGKNQVQVA